MQSREKLSKGTKWLIGLACALGLCVLALAASYPAIRVRIKARGLYSSDGEIRLRAWEALQEMGLPGRMALLGAVRRGDDEVGLDAQLHLHTDLEEDITAGLGIEPVIRAAIKGMDDPGNVGIRCAGIASEGWAVDLLDEETKRAIISKCIEVKITARPEYPVGIGGPRVVSTQHELFGGPLFWHKCELAIDEQSFRTVGIGFCEGAGQIVWNIGLEEQPGAHTVRAKVEVELQAGFIIGKTRSGVDDTGWKMNFQTEPVTFQIIDRVEDNYLQAQATPELAELVGQALKLEKGNPNHSISYALQVGPVEMDGTSVRYLRLDRELPVDLAFECRWHVAEEGKDDRTYQGYHVVILKGDAEQHRLQLPDGLLKGMDESGEQTLTCTVTLEPSLEAALNHPDVEAYWPQPIELPEFTIPLNVEQVRRWMTKISINPIDPSPAK